MKYLASLTLGLVLSGIVAAHAQVLDKKGLTVNGARKVIAAAVADVKSKGAPGGAIAVVDEGGNLIALERLDGTFAAASSISVGKARTAALFQKPTKIFEDIVNGGRTTMVALSDFTPLQGGVPLVHDGQVVGGIGVSGAASAQQDEEIAVAGASVLAASAASSSETKSSGATTYIESEKVKAAFAKGAPLLEVEGYKVHASRRDGPGIAEIHTWETDVIYVLEGSATFVTGGTVVEPKTTEPGQIRGPSIRGGESRRIAKGDVIIVPNGVPHWFKEVQGPFLYFVVKPIAPSEVAK